MRKKKQLTELETRNDDETMCHKYYGQALFQLALKAGPGATEFPYHGQPFKPEEFAETFENRQFTQTEYLVFLSAQGFDINEIRAGVSSIHQSIDEDHERAKAFFKIFKTDWSIDQSDIEKYLDHDSIHHFIKLVVADSASTKARLKAIKGHAKNHSDKAKVFDWCDKTMSNFSSMDDAAFDIAETFIPQKFRAVRDWMTEWKKLRSASTP